MAVKAIAFDIDGTLYPNWRMKLFSLPFLVSHLPLVLAFSKVRKDMRKVDKIDDFKAIQTSFMARELKVTPEEAGAAVDSIIYKKWENIFRRVKPFSGLQTALEELKARGYALGVMSDFPVGHKLRYFRLDGHWDVTMSSEDTGYLKPHAAPFLALAEKLGCAPEEVLYVGNSYAYDVKGAHAAGMKSVYVHWRGKNVPPADLTIRNYRNFIQKIDSLLREE